MMEATASYPNELVMTIRLSQSEVDKIMELSSFGSTTAPQCMNPPPMTDADKLRDTIANTVIRECQRAKKAEDEYWRVVGR
jgi:hypothetical protein